MIELADVTKTFTLHQQGGQVLAVIRGASFRVDPGECVALTGPSGSGKSTVMRMVYGNYLAQAGSIRVAGLELTRAAPREISALRRDRLGYVSQFLRVVPRVPTLEVVAEPLLSLGVARGDAEARAAEAELASRVLPPDLSAATTDGGTTAKASQAQAAECWRPVAGLVSGTAQRDSQAGAQP